MTIRIYVKENCGLCESAKELLKFKGAEWVEIDIDKDKEIYTILNTSRVITPQIFFGDKHIGSHNQLFALEKAGHLDRLLNELRSGEVVIS